MSRVAHELSKIRFGKSAFDLNSIYKRAEFEHDFKVQIINESSLSKLVLGSKAREQIR